MVTDMDTEQTWTRTWRHRHGQGHGLGHRRGCGHGRGHRHGLRFGHGHEHGLGN
jgi:hypothetical protein